MISPTQSQKKLIHGVQFPPPGRYVVAVSGGVDSVALLDMLASFGSDLDLSVAHFDHGWADHPETEARASVAALTKVLNLPLYTGDAKSAPMSEEQGRRQRYEFLFGLAAALAAQGVITAHHADDRLETSFFNVSRGTSRRGRAASLDHPGIWRPLLGVSKAELEVYATAAGLPVWTDSADSDLRFHRNFVRTEIIPLAEAAQPGFNWLYSQLMNSSQTISSQIETKLNLLLSEVSSRTGDGLSFDRRQLSQLPLAVTAELLAHGIRQIEPGLQLSKERLKHLALAVKTGRPGIVKDIAGRLKLRVGYDMVAVVLPRPKAAANLENITSGTQRQ